MRQGLAGSMAQSSAQILDRFLNILPTVTIREGHRVKVYLSGDLALPDYNNHKMPSDLSAREKTKDEEDSCLPACPGPICRNCVRPVWNWNRLRPHELPQRS